MGAKRTGENKGQWLDPWSKRRKQSKGAGGFTDQQAAWLSTGPSRFFMTSCNASAALLVGLSRVTASSLPTQLQRQHTRQCWMLSGSGQPPSSGLAQTAEAHVLLDHACHSTPLPLSSLPALLPFPSSARAYSLSLPATFEYPLGFHRRAIKVQPQTQS